MKKIIILAAAFLMSTAAFAQIGSPTSTSNGTGTGTANAATGASTSALNFNPVSNYQSKDPAANSVFAPSINNTANCIKGASFGFGVKEFGIAAGGGGSDEWCQIGREIEVTLVIDGPEAAREVACNWPRYRATRQRLQRPCIEDTKEYQDRVAKDKQFAQQQQTAKLGYSGNDPIVIKRLEDAKQ